MPSVLVTGASTGIGKTTALQLARKGWKVYAGVRSTSAGDALTAEAGGADLTPLIIDVTDPATCAAAMEAVGGSLDALINNAGIAVGGPVEAVALERLRMQLEVNVIGQVAMTQAALPALRAARGRIVFISSIGGRVAAPFLSPYNASKYAVEAIADALRAEVLPWGIEVAVINPGSVATPIWDKATDQLAEMDSSLSPEHRELYGDSMAAYDKLIGRVARAAVPPEKVADKVEAALTDRRPRPNTLVGLDARIQLVAGKALPKRLGARVTRRAMGL